MSDSRSILVVNCWDDSNKGDAAITIGLLNALKANRGAEVLQVSSYSAHPGQQALAHAFRHVTNAHPDVEVVPCSLPALSRSLPPRTVAKRFFASVLKLIAPSLIRDTQLDAAVRHARVVLSNGGLYFGFRPSSFANMLYHLFAFSYPLLLARRLGVPYVLYSQSFGPFPSRLCRAWMRMLVNGSSGAWCRESMSLKALEALRVDSTRLRLVPDAAFGISGRDAANSPSPVASLAPRQYVAISLRSLVPAGFTAEAESNYLASFAQAIEWLVTEHGLKVVLVAHTIGPIEDEDDRTTTRSVFATLSPAALAGCEVCEQDLSPGELCRLYGQARLVIATRFHAVVLAICGGAPVLAIPYFGVKTQGAFQDLGLSSLVLSVDKITPEVLRQKIALCLENASRLRLEIESIAERQHRGAMQSGAMLNELATTT